jgi:hypothetical protein
VGANNVAPVDRHAVIPETEHLGRFCGFTAN